MKIEDKSNVQEFLKILGDLASHHIEIGIFGDKGMGASSYIDKSGNTVELLVIAGVHEFGATIKLAGGKSFTMPERSFIRAGYDENRTYIEREGEKLLERVMNFQLSVDMFYQTLAEITVGKIQEYLTDMDSPPLKQSTIDRKGSSGVLIDTGRLRQSITYKVVRS